MFWKTSIVLFIWTVLFGIYYVKPKKNSYADWLLFSVTVFMCFLTSYLCFNVED